MKPRERLAAMQREVSARMAAKKAMARNPGWPQRGRTVRICAECRGGRCTGCRGEECRCLCRSVLQRMLGLRAEPVVEKQLESPRRVEQMMRLAGMLERRRA